MLEFEIKLGFSNLHGDVPLIDHSILVGVHADRLHGWRRQNILPAIVDWLERGVLVSAIGHCVPIRVVYEEHLSIKLIAVADLGVFLRHCRFGPKICKM